MPYDPRPVSEGGNRGIDEEFTRYGKKKYRVVGVDTFDGSDWVVGDYDTRKEAIGIANSKGGQMTRMHVYDTNGKCIHSAGSY